MRECDRCEQPATHVCLGGPGSLSLCFCPAHALKHEAECRLPMHEIGSQRRRDLHLFFEPSGHTFLCAACWEELGGLHAQELPDDAEILAAIRELADWQRSGGGCQWCEMSVATVPELVGAA